MNTYLGVPKKQVNKESVEKFLKKIQKFSGKDLLLDLQTLSKCQ